MPKTSNQVANIVLACESEDAAALIGNVDKVMTRKLVESIDRKRKEIGSTIFENVVVSEDSDSDNDQYESYSPEVQESIDYVIESINESDLELENTIQMASKQFNVNEETLREYFSSLLEQAEPDSTDSDDEDDKGGVRDDMDTNKRTHYESFMEGIKNGGKVSFDNKTHYKVSPVEGKALHYVFSNLNEENQILMVESLKSDHSSLLKLVNFSLKMLTE